MKQSYDIVIVGSGIGGLSTLLYLSETPLFKEGNLSIALIVKRALAQTNTNWAQGGIAAVHALGDNFEKHIQDTIVAGAYVNNQNIVEKVIKAAPSLMEDLINWGTSFDKNDANDFDLAKEGGHSDARVWHKEDKTGEVIQAVLISKLNKLKQVDVLEFGSLVAVNKVEETFFNLEVYDLVHQSFINLSCQKLVLATGGLGMLFEKTTNQKVATADGIYIAKQLGAIIENISFIQFHPTGLFQDGNISFLISEALRGAGGILRNEKGEAFMANYDSRLDLAPRDIVSRAIHQEISNQNINYVYLDVTKIAPSILNTHFPSIKTECMLRLGIDIEKEYIPVVPIQHYSCGGVKVDEFGETTVKGLFAIGEIASTGLHGANRLASNSLLEAIAFAKFATASLTTNIDVKRTSNYEWNVPRIKKIDKAAIQYIMSTYAGIVKSNHGLMEAKKNLLVLKNAAGAESEFNLDHFEAACLLEVALMLIEDAQAQKVNKGVFYNSDLA